VSVDGEETNVNTLRYIITIPPLSHLAWKIVLNRVSTKDNLKNKKSI